MSPNNRGSFRFPIHEDRAHVTVLVDRVPHSAVLADMSAGGFGFLMLRGLQLSADSEVSLLMDDTLFECRVAYARPDQAFQFIGVERLRDLSVLSLPQMNAPSTFYKESPVGSNPLIFVAVVVGFTGLMVGTLSFVGVGGNQRPRAAQLTQTRELDGLKKDLAQSELQFPAEGIQQVTDTVANARRYVISLAEKQNRAANLMTGSRRLTWETLVKQLELSGGQVDRLLQLAVDQPDAAVPSLESAKERRAQALTVLTPEQRTRFSQLIATGPL